MKLTLRILGAAVLAFATAKLSALFAIPGVLMAMAIPSYAGSSSFGQSNATHLDLSDELSAVLLADVFLLGRIPVAGEALAVDHYWTEDVLNATTFTVALSMTAGATSIVVSSATGVAAGTLFVDVSTPSDEVMQVTAVSGTTLTIVRGVGDSAPAAAAHAAGSTFRIIGNPKQEGDETVTDLSVARPRLGNTCQIFKKEVAISGTLMAIHLAGVPDEYNYQLAHRTLEIRRELGQSVYGSVRITAGGSGGSSSVIRSMDGLYNYIRRGQTLASYTPNGALPQINTTDTAFSEDLINRLYRYIYFQGGEATFAVGTADQMTKFSALYKDEVRLAPSDRQRGVFVTKFLTDLGVELDLLIDRWAYTNTVIVGDERRLRLSPLRGRAWQATPLAKQGDSFRGMVVGEYTLEVRNSAQCFAMANNLGI